MEVIDEIKNVVKRFKNILSKLTCEGTKLGCWIAVELFREFLWSWGYFFILVLFNFINFKKKLIIILEKSYFLIPKTYGKP